MIGRLLENRYLIQRKLGTGGMATVYFAMDTSTHTSVAIKILHAQFSEDNAYLERLDREANMAIELHSPYIVRVIAKGADDGVPFLVLEYIEGDNLAQWLQRGGPFRVDITLKICRQIALALQYASEHDIVHRDIKPQNIMLSPEGQVKVLDFGIARVRSLPTMTFSGFLGSPYYISPEQAKGLKADVRSDLYSLGIVMYELLSGRPPFDADAPWVVINMHLTQEPYPLSRSHRHIPPEVDTLVLRLLSKDPERRFATPKELVATIDKLSSLLTTGPLFSAPTAVTPPPRELPSPSSVAQPKIELLEMLYSQAQSSLQSGRWQWAIYLLDQILIIDPDYRDVQEQLNQARRKGELASLFHEAKKLAEHENWESAAQKLRLVLDISPRFVEAEMLLYKVLERISFEQSQQRRASAEPLYRLAVNYYRQRQWSQALTYLHQAKDISPNDSDIELLLAEVSHKMQKEENQNSIIRRNVSIRDLFLDKDSK